MDIEQQQEQAVRMWAVDHAKALATDPYGRATDKVRQIVEIAAVLEEYVLGKSPAA